MDIATIITLLLALYGAGLSSVVAWHQFISDRRRVSMLVDLPYDDNNGKLTITNTGHRPITITAVDLHVWGRPKPKATKAILASKLLTTGEIDTDIGKGNLPVTLGDGQPLGVPIEPHFEQVIFNSQGKLLVRARDSEGNEYTQYKKGMFWKLRRS